MDQIAEFKRQAVFGAPYADRIGFGLAVRLLTLRQNRQHDRPVLDEIDFLEGLAPHSMTKPATQFKRPPLHPLWHKHFSTAQHLLANIGIRWGIEAGGNRDLTAMITDIAKEHGEEPALWQGKLVHDFVIGGYQDRTSAKRMTGDWIIFAKHAGQNYYLDLAKHEEAKSPDLLVAKLRGGSAWEFSFCFEPA